MILPWCPYFVCWPVSTWKPCLSDSSSPFCADVQTILWSQPAAKYSKPCMHNASTAFNNLPEHPRRRESSKVRCQANSQHKGTLWPPRMFLLMSLFFRMMYDRVIPWLVNSVSIDSVIEVCSKIEFASIFRARTCFDFIFARTLLVTQAPMFCRRSRMVGNRSHLCACKRSKGLVMECGYSTFLPKCCWFLGY